MGKACLFRTLCFTSRHSIEFGGEQEQPSFWGVKGGARSDLWPTAGD
jgi:hypothetical protein